MPEARPTLLGVLDRLRTEPWVDEVVVGEELDRLGFAPSGGVVAAVNMARRAEANDYGVAGRRWTAMEDGKRPVIGWGQHGGWGPDETRPFLLFNAPQLAPGSVERPTALVDIAPRFSISSACRPTAWTAARCSGEIPHRRSL